MITTSTTLQNWKNKNIGPKTLIIKKEKKKSTENQGFRQRCVSRRLIDLLTGRSTLQLGLAPPWVSCPVKLQGRGLTTPSPMHIMYYPFQWKFWVLEWYLPWTMYSLGVFRIHAFFNVLQNWPATRIGHRKVWWIVKLKVGRY